MSKPTKFNVQKAIELFRETPSWRAVALELGVHPFSIQHALEPLGFKSVKPVGQQRTWDVKKAAKMRKKGITYEKIGEEVGASGCAVRMALVELYGKGGGYRKYTTRAAESNRRRQIK
jgi:hypothetical protein